MNFHINVVILEEPKVLIGSNQNGIAVKKSDFYFLISRMIKLPAERKNLTHSVCEAELGNPV